MPYLEILGYAASGAVFMTFWMKAMIPLRIMGLVSNILFFSYGAYDHLVPIMILHGCLLPLNLLRLYQTVRLKRRIHELAHAEFDVESLLPFMSERRIDKGTVLWRRGDPASDIFYLSSGRVRIEELGLDVTPGNLIGEIAMFSPDRQRTQTVTCLQDCLFLAISEEKVLELFSDNPEFGLYLIKMIVNRLSANLEITATKPA
ncbi:MAG TPA: cyclic nucleotide-binding protein [Rhodospirillaceae bacterium]|nr:cyclic nucleotide-binding protein [Rhodospirillaceae bacterium]